MAFSKLSVFATSKHNTNVKGFALTLLCHRVCQNSTFPGGAGRRGCRARPCKIHPGLSRPAQFAGSGRAPPGCLQQTCPRREGQVASPDAGGRGSSGPPPPWTPPRCGACPGRGTRCGWGGRVPAAGAVMRLREHPAYPFSGSTPESLANCCERMQRAKRLT